MYYLSGPGNGLTPNLSVAKLKPEVARIDFTVFTKAQCDLTWKLFSDWERWPSFSDCCSPRIQWQGTPWACGSRLITEIVHPVRAKVDRVITLCTPPRCVAWISHVCGFTMEQCVLFDPYAGGGTRIDTWIDFTGAESTADAKEVRLLLKGILEKWLGNFCEECDRVAKSML